MVACVYNPSYSRLRKNGLNSGGRGCSELRLCHCTPAWVTEQDSISKQKKKNDKKSCMLFYPSSAGFTKNTHSKNPIHESWNFNREQSQRSCLSKKIIWKVGQVQWLTPVISALWDAETGGSPEVKSLRPAWSTWWNPTSTKNTKEKKLAGHGGRHL